MFVIYESRDEVLITTKEKEAEFLTEVMDRDLENDYDRSEFGPHETGVTIKIAGFRIR